MLNQIKNILFSCFLFLFVFIGHSQVITLGSGTFTGSNFAGPANTSTIAGAASRYAYIFPSNLLTSLKHGDTIRSLSFHRNAGGSLSGTANLKIYIRTTVNTGYGPQSINWVNRTGATGMKKVYDKNPAADMGSGNSWVRFTFSQPYIVDTVLGKNFEMLVEYSQTSAQSTNIFWSFENSGTVGGYQANQVKFVRTNGGTLTDTTNSSTELHPTMRIEFPRSDFDVSVSKIYSLGKLPVPLGNPDTVRAIISNVGKKAVTNFKIFLRSKGANKLIDSAVYSLAYLEEKLLNMPLLYPSNSGLDTLMVIIGKDENASNDTASTLRLATDFVYSYKDPSLPTAGGIGFNGSTGDFVAKFYSNTSEFINQVSVNFSGSNQKFKLGIWMADGKGGSPKTNIWTSDTLVSAPNFITPVWPPVAVNGAFFIGVRQIGVNNVAFGYQPDVPVRPGTFYFASPTGDTNWVDFSPDAPFKFLIEPRLQAKKDLSPISYDFPKDTIKLADVVKVAPKATILNYGSDYQLTPFTVKMNITRNNLLVYTSSRQDTLSSGRKHKITFDSTLFPNTAGDYIVTVITSLAGDQLKDNDTLKAKFVVAAFKDVGPATIFDPGNGVDYEQYVDTIYPTVFIQNYGLDKQGPFNVTAEIFDSLNNLIYSDIKPFTLTSLNSVLASFKPFPCSSKGTFYFRAFTALAIDIDKSNDTVRRKFKIIRSNDVGVTAVIYPANNKSLPFPTAAKLPNVIVENMGDANQGDQFTVHCDIYFDSTLIYSDSTTTNSFRTIPSNILFKSFKPLQKGYYRMLAYTALNTDQYRLNDTFVSVFAVGVPDDVEVINITPNANSILQMNTVYATSVTVRNNGYHPQKTPFPLVFKVSRGQKTTYLKVINIAIDSGETKTFIIDTSLSLLKDSLYHVQVYTLLGSDFVKSNDTLHAEYYAAKSYDIGVSSILYPTVSDTLLIGTQNVVPKLNVMNFGDSLVKSRFKVTLKIFLSSNNALIYNKSIDTNFVSTSSFDLVYPAFGFSGNAQDIKIKAYTELSNDQFRGNDTATGIGRFMLLKDVVAVVVVNPADKSLHQTTDAAINPVIRIRNDGVLSLTGNLSRIVIQRVDTVNNQETQVYSDSVMVSNLLPSEVRAITFNRQFIFSSQTPGVYKCYISNVLSDDQDPRNNALQTSFRISKGTGIDDINLVLFRLYPNPSNNLVHVEMDESLHGPQLMEIMDVQGRIVYSCILSEKINDINVQPLSEGTYFVKINQQVIKILVQH